MFDWAGWVYCGRRRQRPLALARKTNYPIQSGMTPTAGGVVFFGDMGGNFYALDAKTAINCGARRLAAPSAAASSPTRGEGQQRVAVATGLTEVLWPSEQTTAKVSVLGIKPKE